jgi:O-antigen/teichoic acid export membrane protein
VEELSSPLVKTAHRPRSVRSIVVEHTGKYTLGQAVNAGGALLNSYAAALLLGPAVWGVWQGASLVWKYASLGHFGVVDAVNREVPRLRGANDLVAQRRVVDTGFTFILVMAALLGTVAFCIGSLPALDPSWRIALRITAFLIVAQFLATYFGTLLMAHHAFDAVSTTAVIAGLVQAASIALIPAFGLTGFLLGQVLVLSAMAGYSWWKAPLRPRLAWNAPALRGLFLIGIPITLMVVAGTLYITIDRFFILGRFDEAILAFYTLGYLLFAPFQLILSANRNVIFPRLAERVGASRDIRSVLNYVALPLQASGLVLSFLLGLLCIFLPTLISTFLPAYMDGAEAAQVLLFGLFFIDASGLANNVFVALNRTYVRLGLLLAAIAVNAGAMAMALHWGAGILGVAFATSTGYLLFFVASTAIGLRYVQATWRETATVIARTLLPVAAVALILLAPHALALSTGSIPVLMLQVLLVVGLLAYPTAQTIRRTLDRSSA